MSTGIKCDKCQRPIEDVGALYKGMCFRCCAETMTALQSELTAKDELIFAYDQTRTPVIDKTIIDLRAELDDLKASLREEEAEDGEE